ncbi:MAG: hydroxyacid dehydrogenase [Candidatus Cloacimonetes bacterium 4572_55]|nr:MAG: hydroxyacid dehydrogenase [Candidatus Cloacimonetes bacterium 4572_55]
MKILISDAFDPSLPGKLERFGEVTTDKSLLPEVDVVLIRSKTKCTKDYMDSAKNLKLIIRGGVGLDNVDRVYAKEKGIAVYNTASASAIAVAELAFAMMIAVPSHIVKAHNSMADGKWIKKQLKRTELFGKTLGLLGVGHIGSEVAKRAVAFGMKVVAYDPLFKEHAHAVIVHSVEEMVKDADYISLHVPLVESTKELINKELIEKMKDGVVVINTARGKIVVEEDMAEALKNGKVKTYATDVWYSDPPDSSSPILSAPNTLLAPHIGASSKENLLRIGDVIVDILDNFVKE